MDFKYVMFREVNYLEQWTYMIKIHNFLLDLRLKYPNFDNWYYSLFSKQGVLLQGRSIILCKSEDKLVGVIILKKSLQEQKVCTLKVHKDYRGLGIGKYLLEKSFEYLNMDKPLITFHASDYNYFKGLVCRYNFSLAQEYNRYNLWDTELCYNGVLL